MLLTLLLNWKVCLKKRETLLGFFLVLVIEFNLRTYSDIFNLLISILLWTVEYRSNIWICLYFHLETSIIRRHIDGFDISFNKDHQIKQNCEMIILNKSIKQKTKTIKNIKNQDIKKPFFRRSIFFMKLRLSSPNYTH